MAFLPVIGAIASAAGSIVGGIAAGNNASYQSQVAANNQTIALQNASYAESAGVAQTQAVGLQNAETAGAIKTSQAANNVDVNSGSALDVQKSQRELGELGEQTTMNNAELNAYGYQVQASNFGAESGLLSQEAGQAPIMGALGAGGSLLGNSSAFGGGSAFTTLWNSATSSNNANVAPSLNSTPVNASPYAAPSTYNF
jgi:hypothetical protein